MMFFDQNAFIKDHVTCRQTSLFEVDVRSNKKLLESRIKGKSILVIGGAGTIGSNFIKSVLRFLPERLVIVDYSENNLTELTRDLRSSLDITVPKKYVTYPLDFGGSIFKKLFTKYHFDIIASFAAHKHVRSEKDEIAIEAMVRNNILNMIELLELSKINPPDHFFCVSTDKAANPVNVMGASKKIMENLLLSFQSEFKITTARFANVAFSNGSLLYGFLERISKKQPLSSPTDVKRYFVSPEEAGQLCLIACVLGDSGDIFYPKLNADEMKTFSSIAEILLKKLNLKCDYCDSEEKAKYKAKTWSFPNRYPVYFFKSDTSGEKLFEEFYVDSDKRNEHTFENLGIVHNTSKYDRNYVIKVLKSFKQIFNTGDLTKEKIIEKLNELLPEFTHHETGKNLDQKM